MPSFNKISRKSGNSKGKRSAVTSKIYARFYSPGDGPASQKGRAASVSMSDSRTFKSLASQLSPTEYANTASADLSNIFYPFNLQSSGTESYSSLPSGHMYMSSPTSGETTYTVVAHDILPFELDENLDGSLFNLDVRTSGDCLGLVFGGNKTFLDDSIRDHTSVRGIGLRTPMMVTGWGFDTEGFPAPASGDLYSGFSFPSGVKGKDVNPKDYIAAPLDLRYDMFKGVWTTDNGFRLAKIGTKIDDGKYKCSTIRGLTIQPNGSDVTAGILGKSFIADDAIIYDHTIKDEDGGDGVLADLSEDGNVYTFVKVGYDNTLKKEILVKIGGGSSLLRPCTLAKTSGNDGTASAACSWVYTVTDALTEAEVATGISPAHNRLYGTTYYATIGTYYLDSEGTCILHWTDEQPKPFGCTTA